MALPVVDYDRIQRVYSAPPVAPSEMNWSTRLCLAIIGAAVLVLFLRFLKKRKESF
jgi:hypothetical protein